MSIGSEVQDQGRKAIDMFLAAVTYPVVWTNGDRLETLGSGVLFRHGDRHFLLTARHLFDDYDKKTHTEFPYDGLVGPIDLATIEPRKLGRKFVHITHGNRATSGDIIAIELLDDAFVRKLKLTWQFIDIEHFDLPDRDSLYFVAGFPKIRERKTGEMIGASFMSLTTQRLSTAPTGVKKYDARYDVILDYDKTAADSYNGNKPVDAPFVGGVSGGPVFRVASKAPKIWTPKTGIAFMGLQVSSTKTNAWLRVKNVHAIHRYFDDAIPSIGASIAKKLGKRPRLNPSIAPRARSP
ncbi:trypsin-like peptidase domain-containing protein [Bradyrhizobium iriomotense]|uniref:trypsin-like peptidase domain-containing protein n=1 Tax=Bradyrhizobium iriomotense TaxID=441950 RepID=UPI001B8A81C5|nr:hypothetical protein [Bradyrhizobium iriomotense]MBR1132492.1 hypothetical protein [Bradyrhizobium iriomotense]